MAEITLKKAQDPGLAPLTINLENEVTGQTETYKYNIKRLGGKAAMQVNLLLAEFARDKNRDALLGSSMMKEIMDRTTPVGDAPAILELFDLVGDKELQQLAEAMITAAKSPSVEA